MHKTIAYWLFFCCFMIALMVLVGGLTRLTESGLSIVKWQPISGAIPPLSENDWQEAFTQYQQTPEYQKKNIGMELTEFKSIFLWEYTHRLLGRSVGVVFLLPFLYFLATRRISRRYAKHFSLIFLLGGLQGGIGWYMVKSGLVDRPDVSQYRLTLHLGTAFLLYALILWTALTLLRVGVYSDTVKKAIIPREKGALPNLAIAITFMVAIQVLSGGFVAGLDAGLIYNTFPSMNGAYIPAGLGAMQPWYLNPFENITMVQFNHRLWAMLTSLVIISFWLFIQKNKEKLILTLSERNLVHGLIIMLVIQFSLGVATLLHAVPIALASLHQMGALALFTISLAVSHTMVYREKQSSLSGY